MIRLLRDPLDELAVNVLAARSRTRRIRTFNVGGTRPLYALDDRLFVRHGVRGFRLFERDSTGKVTRLVNWRDSNPVVWRRER